MVTDVVIDGSAIPDGHGGAATYVRSLVRSLPDAGVVPTVIARKHGPGSWPGAGHVLARAPRSRPLRLAWEQLALARSVRDARVLHSPHYTMPRYLPRHLSHGTTTARIVTVHDLTFFTRPQDHDRSKLALFTSAIRYAARHADALVAVSQATADDLDRLVGARCPVSVIPHGVDHERFRPVADAAERQNDAERLLAFGLDRPYVMHLGTIEPRKNVGGLLRAYEMLRNDMTKSNAVCGRSDAVPLLVLAGGAWPAEWEAIRSRAAAVGAVRLGEVSDDDVVTLLRNAAAVAYPSFAEGYGIPVIEALAAGAPVVTSRGSVMEQLAGEAVLLADPAAPASIATALRRALDGDGPSQSQRRSVAAKYRWSEAAAAHAALYARF